MQPIPGDRASYPRWQCITALIVVALLAVFFTVLWKRSPRQALGDFSLVQIGPGGIESDHVFRGSLNLPWSSFECSPTQDTRTCSREFEGKMLRLEVPRYATFPAGGSCSADFGGLAVPCMVSFVHRGFPELVVRLDDALGISPERRAWLRSLDPFSHMSEGDFGIPIWIVALIGGVGATWIVQPFLRNRRRWLNLILIALCFWSGLIFSGFVFLMTLFSMGYGD